MPFFQTERRRAAEFIISEAQHFRSRDVLTIEAGANLEPGTVVSPAGAGTFKAFNPDTLDLPYGVIMHPAAAAAAPVKVTAIVRDAEINALTVAWPEGITEAQKADAISGLENRGLIVRG